MDRKLDDVYSSVTLPLIGSESSVPIFGDSVQNASGFVLNMVPKVSINPVTQSSEIVYEKREGHSAVFSVLSKTGLSGTMVAKDLITISGVSDVLVGAFFRNTGGTLSIEIIQLRPIASTATVIGAISTVAGPPAVNISNNTVVHLTEIKQGNVPGVAVVITDPSESSGTSAAYYALTASGVFTAASLTKISDADFPTNQTPYVHIVGPLVQMNEINYVMARTGVIYNSNSDAIGTWSALGFLEAQSYADRGIGLGRYKHHVVAFGDTSIEFFNDVGNDPTLGSPLERTEQAFIRFGCIYSKAYINVDDTLYWISNSNPLTLGVWKLDGYTPVKVSDNSIDNLVGSTASTRANWNLNSIVLRGTKNILLSSGSGSGTQSASMLLATISYETNEPQISGTDMTALIHCYNVQSNKWWCYNSGSFLRNNGFLCVTSYVTGINTVAATTQYLLQGEHGLSTGTDNTQYLMKVIVDGDLLDYDAVNSVDDEYLTYFELPIIWFGTEQRKFLHKVKLLSDTVFSASAVVIPTRIKALFQKDHSTTILVKTSSNLTTAGVSRMSWNNFGVFRKLKLGFMYKGDSYFSVIGVEADVSQGEF